MRTPKQYRKRPDKDYATDLVTENPNAVFLLKAMIKFYEEARRYGVREGKSLAQAVDLLATVTTPSNEGPQCPGCGQFSTEMKTHKCDFMLRGTLNLRERNLTNYQLYKLNLNSQDMTNASLVRANLRGSNLAFSVLYGADLTKADLRQTNLNQANLRYANLRGTDLRGANLYMADLRGANLYEAVFDDNDWKNKVFWDKYTTWPANINPPNKGKAAAAGYYHSD